MDTLKIKTGFGRKLVSSMAEKECEKALGSKPSISLEDIDIQMDDSGAKIHISADVKLNKFQVEKLMKLIGLM